jgi:dTDP-glucose pyrophosphorylase
MTIIFPMAGLSSRFTKAGYDKPKYMLKVDEKTVFFHAVNSFKKYFDNCKILFIYRDIQNTKEFIENECLNMNIKSFELVKLDYETEGQAHTVALGLEKANIPDDESILIFNIDTFRPNFELPKEINFDTVDGYLEVFEAEGEHWSFVLPENENSNKVIKTTEKERISSLCSSGLYYFKKSIDFSQVFKEIVEKNDRSKNEYYIAPMYNYLIKEGKDIRYSKIDLKEIVFCGTPDEYKKIIAN